jgi:hypothetical protein
LLGDFNTKVAIGNESWHEITNDNGVKVVNFAISKNLAVKVKCSHVVTFIISLGHFLMERRTTKLTTFLYIGDDIQVYLMSDSSRR